jgi:two-component system nitrogen regulation sensor histidine kinase NtrY
LNERILDGTKITYTRWTRLFAWAQRARLARKLAVALTFAAAASGIATYVALTGSPPFGPDPRALLIFVILDLVLLLPLVALIALQIVRLWAGRRKGRAGSRLHARLVLLFALLAATPAITVAIFSALFFNFGIQAWFNERVGTALRESLAITNLYLGEKDQAAREDLEGLVSDINRQAIRLMDEPNALAPFVVAAGRERRVSGIYVFDARGRILVDSGMSLSFERARDLDAIKDKLEDNTLVLLNSSQAGHLRAITRLNLYYDSDVYLVMERPLDSALVEHVNRLRQAVDEYIRLESQRSGIEITFFALFAGVSLLLLLAAVWLGFIIANQLVSPIGELITAAELVGTGDLKVRVREVAGDNELSGLSRSFNRMTSQLARNREELIEANRQLDARREFTETVLAGVSAGVIGLDREGRINLPNRSAAELLGLNLQTRIGEPLGAVVPEMADILGAIADRPDRLHDGEVQIRRDGGERTLLVRVATERLRGEAVGFVVTFDDITELQAAQRKAAWGDIARRIAHEIKNPLTPIQLSAERLRRKYLAQITSDREAFDVYTDTIIRQVGDIGRLVDEFSAFARMPVPSIRSENLCELCRHAIFLERNSHPEIDYVLAADEDPLIVPCDGRLISQAVVNILRNAGDSIGEQQRLIEDGERRGRIEVRLARDAASASIVVSDDGVGLPPALLARLTEPYVTTRTKGTGLGLAIVRKILEDHGGAIRLDNRPEGGARVALVLPLLPAETAVESEKAAE